jgi:hypothetical protein
MLTGGHSQTSQSDECLSHPFMARYYSFACADWLAVVQLPICRLCWQAIVACNVPTRVWQGVGRGGCSLATCRRPKKGVTCRMAAVALQFALKLEKFPERKSVLHETKVRDQLVQAGSARAVLITPWTLCCSCHSSSCRRCSSGKALVVEFQHACRNA